jgi:hypothetical protein
MAFRVAISLVDTTAWLGGGGFEPTNVDFENAL